MERQEALTLFEQSTKGLFGKYINIVPFGQTQFDTAKPDQRGFVLYLQDAGANYQFFGGTGFGDAYQMVDYRFEYDKLKTETFKVTPYELKHNPQPICLIGCYIDGLGACLWANGVLISQVPGKSNYRNPYNVNLNADKKVLFAGTLNTAFKADDVTRVTEATKQLMIDLGKELPVPQLEQVTQYIVR